MGASPRDVAGPVLDFHVHVGSRQHFPAAAVDLGSTFGDNGMVGMWDGDGEVIVERVLAYLDAEGIDHACLIPVNTGDGALATLDIAAAGRGRLHPFVSVDPAAPDPASTLDAACRRGAKGLKVHPVHSHAFADDRRLYPVYEVAAAWGIPVMFHVGSSVFPGAKHAYADPLRIDTVAEDFPGLSIVCAHGGRGFWESAVYFMTKLRPNVYLELSGVPVPRIVQHYPDLHRVSERVLYGSDWPTSPPMGIVAKRFAELKVDDEALRMMMYDNGARLLRLPRSDMS